MGATAGVPGGEVGCGPTPEVGLRAPNNVNKQARRIYFKIKCVKVSKGAGKTDCLITKWTGDRNKLPPV